MGSIDLDPASTFDKPKIKKTGSFIYLRSVKFDTWAFKLDESSNLKASSEYVIPPMNYLI